METIVRGEAVESRLYKCGSTYSEGWALRGWGKFRRGLVSWEMAGLVPKLTGQSAPLGTVGGTLSN